MHTCGKLATMSWTLDIFISGKGKAGLLNFEGISMVNANTGVGMSPCPPKR